MMSLPRGRLFQQILVSMSAALIVAFAVQAAITLMVGGGALKRGAEDDLRGVAHHVNLQVQQFMDARLAELRLTSGIEAMDDIVTRDEHFRIQNTLLRLRRELPGVYEELLVTDMSGATISATRLERLDALMPLDPSTLEAGSDGTRHSAGPVKIANEPDPVVALARPVMSRISGEQSGWLIALVRWDAISQLVRDAPIGGHPQRPGAFAVLTVDGRAQGGGLAWLDDPDGPKHFTIAEDGMRRDGASGSDGSAGTTSITSGPTARWGIVLRRDPEEAFAIVRVFGWSVVGAAVLGLLFAAVVAVRLSSGLARRIEALVRNTRRLAEGDFANRVRDGADDELGDLAGAFDSMAESLQGARQELEGANAELKDNNRRLREASRLKDEFLANVSHELRTPLNGTLGFLGLVNDGLCDSPEEASEHVQQAFRCAQQLKLLIEDVLDVSRIEAGRMQISCEPVRAQHALALIAAEMRPRAQAKGLTLVLEPIEDTRLAARADAQRLQQVLRHLIDNAIKFTPAGTITLACIEREAAGHLRFEVRDTGVGATPEQLERAFDRFVQGDGSATRRFGGTGLGLSLVHDLVQLMGGVVELRSPGSGRGAVAAFTLPLSYASSTRGPGDRVPEPADPIAGPAHGPLVLVIDDDEALTRWLRAILHADGFRTVVTDSAERGWTLVRQLHPNAVILDHALPAGADARIRTGAELARQLAGARATAELPVLMLTGHDPVALEGHGALPRHVQLLPKPARREDLLMHLRRAITADHRRIVRVLLAYDDARLVNTVRRALPEGDFSLALESMGPGLFEMIQSDGPRFDVILLEPTVSSPTLRPLLDALGRLESAPPVIMLAEASAYEDPEIADLAGRWPVRQYFTTAGLETEPDDFRIHVKRLGTSLPAAESPDPRAAA